MRLINLTSYFLRSLVLLLVSNTSYSAGNTVVQDELFLQNSPILCEKGVEYIPLPYYDALTFQNVTVKNGSVQLEQLPWPSSNAEKNAKLPNIATDIAVFESASKVSSLPIFSIEKTSKIIIIDFIKYRSEVVKASSASSGVIYARVGVGMRIIINISELKGGFTGSLSSLAFSAKSDNLKGTISAQVMGIDFPDVTQAMPFTSDLSEASIQRVIEAMAIIKSRLSDDKANLQPQLISQITCKK